MKTLVLLLLVYHAAGTGAAAQESPAAVAFREGMAAQQRGELERAAEAYRRALQAEPRLAEAHANLGAVLARRGQYEEAVASYGRALAINPGLNAVRLNLGLAHYRAGALAAAAAVFEEAYRAEPSLPQVRQLLGLVLVETGRDEEAVAHLEDSLHASPNEPAVLFALGRAYSRRGDPRADVMLERLAATPDGQPLWQQLRGLVLQRADRHAEALDAFEAAALLNADLPHLRVNIGFSRLALGDRDGARHAFEDALARSEREAAAHFYVAWMDEQDDRLADARRHAERAVSLDGGLTGSVGLLGRILLKEGDVAPAVRHLERAVSAEPRNASWRFLLAQGYQRLGNSAGAAREFAEARRLREQEVDQSRQHNSPE